MKITFNSYRGNGIGVQAGIKEYSSCRFSFFLQNKDEPFLSIIDAKYKQKIYDSYEDAEKALNGILVNLLSENYSSRNIMCGEIHAAEEEEKMI